MRTRGYVFVATERVSQTERQREAVAVLLLAAHSAVRHLLIAQSISMSTEVISS